jgi:hypothetical protein
MCDWHHYGIGTELMDHVLPTGTVPQHLADQVLAQWSRRGQTNEETKALNLEQLKKVKGNPHHPGDPQGLQTTSLHQ